ncbi:MAG: hypothetical protein HKP52_13525 [Desulfofustis sp.]|nr:hypothetical protein [Desulfofustis sp.]
MLRQEEVKVERRLSGDHKNLNSEQNIHAFGVSYLCNFLDRARFTILEVNTDPDHHYQLLAKINGKSLLIAVRTAYNPEMGALGTSNMEKLLRESEELNAIPHFAGLSLIPLETNDIEVEGITEGQEFKVMFNGISVVRNSEAFVVNR